VDRALAKAVHTFVRVALAELARGTLLYMRKEAGRAENLNACTKKIANVFYGAVDSED